MVILFITTLATSLPALSVLRNKIVIVTVKFIVIITFVFIVEIITTTIIIPITCILQVSFMTQRCRPFKGTGLLLEYFKIL